MADSERDPIHTASLVRANIDMLRGVCRRHLKNPVDVEDAVQQTFLKWLIGEDRIETNVGAWLRRCAAGTSIDLGRRRTTRTRYEHTPPGCDNDSSENGVETAVAMRDWLPWLDHAIDSLRATERKAIVQHFLHGEPQRVLAERAGISPSGMKRRIDRGLEGIRAYLVAKQIDCGEDVLSHGFRAGIAAGVLWHSRYGYERKGDVMQVADGSGVELTPSRDDFPWVLRRSSQRLEARRWDLRNLLCFAFGIGRSRLRIDQARLPIGLHDCLIQGPEVDQQLRRYFEESFGLSLQRETRQIKVWELTATAEAVDRCRTGEAEFFQVTGEEGAVTFTGASMNDLADWLDHRLFWSQSDGGRAEPAPVVDATGMTGRFDLTLRRADGDTPEAIGQRLQRDTGLSLIQAGPQEVEYLVLSES